MSTPLVRPFLVLAAIALPAPSAVADVTIPNTEAPPAPAPSPTSMLTRWPAVLPCPHSRDLSVSSSYNKDVLRWSSASGAELTLDPNGVRPIPPAFLRDPPRSLTWPQEPRGELVARSVILEVKCADDFGEIRWFCDDGQASCSQLVLYPYGDPGARRRHRSDLARLQRIMQSGAGARDLLIADALRLVQEACAGDRCSDVVPRAVRRLRAATKQPPWKVARPDDHLLELTAPGAPDENLRCNNAAWDRTCTLTLGTLSFMLHGDDTGFGDYECLDDDKWMLASDSFGYSIKDEAMR